jgi:hypothetical protein
MFIKESKKMQVKTPLPAVSGKSTVRKQEKRNA